MICKHFKHLKSFSIDNVYIHAHYIGLRKFKYIADKLPLSFVNLECFSCGPSEFDQLIAALAQINEKKQSRQQKNLANTFNN